MRKRIFAALLAAAVLLTGLPPSVAAGGTGRAMCISTVGVKQGDVVYFGSRSVASTRWVVLDPRAGNAVGEHDTLSDGTQAVGNTAALFLTTQTAFGWSTGASVVFDAAGKPGWQGSDAQRWCGDYAARELTGPELDALLFTTKRDATYQRNDAAWALQYDAEELLDEQVFFTSALETDVYKVNAEDWDDVYGYSRTYDEHAWWLRNGVVNTVSGARGQGVAVQGGIWTATGSNGKMYARPAFNLSKAAVLFSCAADGGKPTGVTGLRPVAAGTPSEWKLTLLDRDRAFRFVTSAVSDDGKVLTLTYSGATPNEYISAVGVADGGMIRCYGSVAKVTGVSGTVAIDISSLDAADTLYVFSEQRNAAGASDYASRPWAASRTVNGYSVTHTLEHLNAQGAAIVEFNCDYAATLVPDAGYLLPAAITVNVGGQALSGGYSYDAATGELVIDKNSITGNVEITASGVAKTYTITTAPETLTFAEILFGDAPPEAQTVTVANTGNMPVTLAQPSATRFDVGALSATSLAVGGSATFTVRPKEGLVPSAYDETISVSTGDDTSSAVRVTYTVGAEIDYTIAPETLTFAVQSSDAQAGAQTVTVTNSGNVPLTLTPSLAASELFSVGNLSASVLPAGGNATFTVQPKSGLSVGVHTGSVTVSTTGGGAATVSATYTVDAAVDYALTGLTTDGAPHTTNGNAEDYAATLVPDAGYLLPAAITVKVGGQALSGGYSYDAATGELVIDKNSITGNVEITASGVAKTYTITTAPETLTFAVQSSDAQAGAQTVTVTNSGNVPLTLTPSLAASELFSVGNLSASVLPADGTATFTVQPKSGLSVGVHTGSVTVSTTGGGAATVSATYTVDAAVKYALTGLTTDGAPHTTNGNAEDYAANLAPDAGYLLPAAITVKVGGQALSGGYSYDAATGELVIDKNSITGNVEITASGVKIVYSTPKPYELTFDTNGGSKIPDVISKYKVDVDLTDYIPVRDGYTFEGWCSDAALTARVTTLTLTKNSIVYAMWSQITPLQPPISASGSFVDVREQDWFSDDVDAVTEKGLMVGVEDDMFAPDDPAERAMVTATIWTMAGKPASDGDAAFNDLQSDMYYTPAILWAAQAEVVSGIDADNFGVNAPVTREELVTMLYAYTRYAGYDAPVAGGLDAYADADKVSSWARDAMIWAVGSGLISGTDGNAIDPAAAATRAELAVILNKFHELREARLNG